VGFRQVQPNKRQNFLGQQQRVRGSFQASKLCTCLQRWARPEEHFSSSGPCLDDRHETRPPQVALSKGTDRYKHSFPPICSPRYMFKPPPVILVPGRVQRRLERNARKDYYRSRRTYARSTVMVVRYGSYVSMHPEGEDCACTCPQTKTIDWINER
jgi:hypothetical protein